MMGFAEPVIGPATSGRTRWLRRSYALRHSGRRAAAQRFATAKKALIDRHNFAFANLWDGVKRVRACAREKRAAQPRVLSA